MKHELNLNLNSERTSLKIFERGAFIVIHSQMTVSVAPLLRKDSPTLTLGVATPVLKQTVFLSCL
jgi:hypothetical protein